MIMVVAICFPILVVAAAWAALRPGAVLRRLPSPPEPVDRSPLPYRTHLVWSLSYLAVGFSLGGVFTMAQHALLVRASDRASWWFSARMSDQLSYAGVVGLFLGIVVAYPLMVRALRWHYGEGLALLLDRRGRDMTGLSLRQEAPVIPRFAAGIAVVAVLLNVATFDTFLLVGEGVFRLSSFFSARTSEYAVKDVSELALYAQRVAPNGRVTNKEVLEIRMKDGTLIDTYDLIDQDQIQNAVAAILDSAGGRVPVSRMRQPKAR